MFESCWAHHKSKNFRANSPYPKGLSWTSQDVPANLPTNVPIVLGNSRLYQVAGIGWCRKWLRSCRSRHVSESSTCFERALELMHQSTVQAVDLLHNAQKLGYDPAACAAQRWYCQMLRGEFEYAWRESDAIGKLKPDCAERLWDG